MYPSGQQQLYIPVLMLLVQDTRDHRPEWVDLHERQLANVAHHKLVMLDGPQLRLD